MYFCQKRSKYWDRYIQTINADPNKSGSSLLAIPSASLRFVVVDLLLYVLGIRKFTLKYQKFEINFDYKISRADYAAK